MSRPGEPLLTRPALLAVGLGIGALIPLAIEYGGRILGNDTLGWGETPRQRPKTRPRKPEQPLRRLLGRWRG